MQVEFLEQPTPRVVVSGEVDADNREEFGERLRQAPGRDLTIDASGLTFIDSSGLSELLAVREERVSDGGVVEVTNATGPVRRVIEIAGLAAALGMG